MNNDERQISTERATPDFSAVAALELPKTPKLKRSERPLRGLERSAWWPVLQCVAVLQLTGISFGPLAPLIIGDWTWIVGFFMCVYSVVPVQICLLNVGLVLGSGPLRQRLLVYWISSLVMLAGWFWWLWLANFAANKFVRNQGTMEDFAEMGMVLPLYIATLQFPLWVVRYWFPPGLINQRLSEIDRVPAKQKSLQFSLRDLLIALGLFAITFGFYRQLWIWASVQDDPFRYSSGWFAMWWRTAGIALAIVPPIIAWLSMRRFSYFAGWFLTLLYAALVTVAGTAIFLYIEDIGLGGGMKEIILAMTAAFVIPLVCGLSVLRFYGWRLEKATSVRSKAT